MTLDEKLAEAGFNTISERLLCNAPLDGMMRHANVNTLDDLLEWVIMVRRENMEMIARHDLGIHELCADTYDFVLGKSSTYWEFHVNLLHVMKGLKDES